MINKVVASTQLAVADIQDRASVMIGGFGQAGVPYNLIDALVELGVRELTVISHALAQCASLVQNKQVRKLITTFARWVDPTRFNPLEEQYAAGELEVELTPIGTLAERIRAGGAGMAAVYTPTGVGTIVEQGKEKRVFEGKEYLLELGIRADVALIKAYKGDRMGNLVYRMTSRNYNPIMAMAGNLTIAEVEEIVDVGQLDSELIVTPGIFVDRVVKAPKRSVWLYQQSPEALSMKVSALSSVTRG